MISANLLYELKLISNHEPEDRKALYEAACGSLNLSVMDYQIMRDLVWYVQDGADCYDLPLEASLISVLAAVQKGDLCLDLALSPDLPENIEGLLKLFNPGDSRYDKLICRLNIEDITQDAAGDIKNCECLRQGLHSVHKPLAAVYSRGICRYLYFNRHLNAALILKRRLCSKAKFDRQLDPETVKPVFQEVVRMSHVPLDVDQILALCQALLKPFVVITGGPGTGKTSIVFTLLRCLLRLGYDPERIMLTAPTGRAAQRLMESLQVSLSSLKEKVECDDLIGGLHGQTIHRLLKYSPSRNSFTHNADNPLPADVLVVDEVSMVDADLMAALLGAVTEETRVVFLGDVNQLPSVDAGGILSDLVDGIGRKKLSSNLMSDVAFLLDGLQVDLPLQDFSPDGEGELDHIGLLRKNHRSNREIAELAESIRNYTGEDQAEILNRFSKIDVKLSKASTTGDFSCLVEWPEVSHSSRMLQLSQNDAAWEGVLKSWVNCHYLSSRDGMSYAELVRSLSLKIDFHRLEDFKTELDRVFMGLDEARILTLIRHGRQGCEWINRFIVRNFMRQFDRRARGELFSGAPVIITSNNYSKELFNGDVGVVLRDRSGVYRAVFKRLGSYVHFDPYMLPSREWAFAITVHKSQGSEYENVFLVFPEQGDQKVCNFQTKEMVYTGVTRAKNTLTIYANDDVLIDACSRRIERINGISLWHKDLVCQNCPEMSP